MLFEEIKKIWSWKKCLCLLAFWILYFLLFISPYVSIYEGSYQQTADIAADIVKKYGNYISEDEYEKMKADAPQKGVSEIDKMIAENALFQSYGFRTFQEFNYAEESLSPDEDTALWMEIYDVFTAEDITREFTRAIELNVYQMYLDRYESEALGKADGTSYYKDLDEAQRQRTLERNWKEVYGILPPQVIGVNFEVLQFWAAFAIISVIFMILPYMVQENRNRMTMLQYSCKRGRKYYLYKLAACLLSVFLVIGAEFMFLYADRKNKPCHRVLECTGCFFFQRIYRMVPLDAGYPVSDECVVLHYDCSGGRTYTLCCHPVLQKSYHGDRLGASPGDTGRLLWRIFSLSFHGDHYMEVSGACGGRNGIGNRHSGSGGTVCFREKEKY